MIDQQYDYLRAFEQQHAGGGGSSPVSPAQRTASRCSTGDLAARRFLTTDTMYESMSAAEKAGLAGLPFSHHEAPSMIVKMGWLLAMLPAAPCRILDCGIGSGWTTEWLSRRGYEVLGIDRDPWVIEHVAQRRHLGRSRLAVVDFEDMRFASMCDAVVFNSCLHHSLQPGLVLRRAFEALRPGGMLVLIEPGAFTRWKNREMIRRSPGRIETSLPPVKLLPLVYRAGFRRCRVYPNTGYLVKTQRSRWVPAWAEGLLPWAYRYLDGQIVCHRPPTREAVC